MKRHLIAVLGFTLASLVSGYAINKNYSEEALNTQEYNKEQPRKISTISELEKAVKENERLVVLFSTTGCSPSTAMDYVVEREASRYRTPIFLFKTEETVNKTFGVEGMPDLLYIENGKAVMRHQGGISIDEEQNPEITDSYEYKRNLEDFDIFMWKVDKLIPIWRSLKQQPEYKQKLKDEMKKSGLEPALKSDGHTAVLFTSSERKFPFYDPKKHLQDAFTFYNTENKDIDAFGIKGHADWNYEHNVNYLRIALTGYKNFSFIHLEDFSKYPAITAEYELFGPKLLIFKNGKSLSGTNPFVNLEDNGAAFDEDIYSFSMFYEFMDRLLDYWERNKK